jgi:perosamine synthetase
VVSSEDRVIRLAAPHITDDDVDAVVDVLRSGQLVQGREVAGLEGALCEVVGSKHAIAVTNCTSALHLALVALGIGPGDDVVVPAFSWPATANVVAFCGARPIFVDIDQRSFAMRPDALQSVLADHPRVRAILPVHPFGEMADIAAIASAGAACGVPIIEDAACALGALAGGAFAGRTGAMGCFSFHPRKAITTGEGGAIVTDDADLARRLRMLRNHGIDPDATTPDFAVAGLNQRMTEIQAALGRSQLRKFDWLIAGRRRLAARYNELFNGSSLQIPMPAEESAHVYQSYVVLLPTDRASDRNTIISRMRAEGIEVSIGTHHIPLLRFYATLFGFKKGDFPTTDSVAERAIALPLHAFLTDEEQIRVANTVQSMIG